MISFRGSNSYYVQPTTFSNTKWIKCGLHEQFWWLFGKYCLLSNRNRRFISVSRAETCHTLSYSVPFWLLMTTWTSLINDRKLARFRFLRSFNMSGNGLMLLLFNYLFPQTRYNVITVCMFLDLQDHLRFDRGVGTSTCCLLLKWWWVFASELSDTF